VGSIRVQVEMGDPAFGAALTVYLAADPSLEVTAEHPDVVVVDCDGPGGTERVATRAGDAGVLAVGEATSERMIAALEAGALGYVAATAPFDQIADGVRSVGDGHGVVPPLMLGALLRHVVHRRRAAQADLDRLVTLTVREREVLELVADGLDRAAIAQQLFISPDTVRTHLMRMFRKLDVHTQAEAVAFAARCGLGTDSEETR
jgi:DNA-binding NarL/FixJ family response regulator